MQQLVLGRCLLINRVLPFDWLNTLCSCFQVKVLWTFLISEQVKPETEEIEDQSSLPFDAETGSPVRTKSKRESREEKESKVYTVATDQTIRSLITQYKRRKQQNSMPNLAKGGKRKSANKSVEELIEEEQQTSIMKVREKRIPVCNFCETMFRKPIANEHWETSFNWTIWLW